ncbi:hypothetical protein [uncultured Bacteroides sp.]|uniref:hypothetical protein n=1 Tax=uncultured Bacteroides sp. TaxID=162156 RepID=UPI0025CCEB79|nr:hypothetical protein [uncultured Bacteroides sp.]
MNEEIKCPNCKGDKVRQMEGNKYKCQYCGMVFQTKQEVLAGNSMVDTEGKSNAPQVVTPPPIYIVNQSKPTSSNNAFVKGVAGGCAGIALWSILGPLLLIIILVASC